MTSLAFIVLRTFDKLEKEEASPQAKALQTSKLASVILSTSLLGMLSVRDDWSLDFLELFREAIGDVAEKHNGLFRKLDESMISGANRINLDQRREGVRPGLEIADIIDELHMLKQLFQTQGDVLMKASRDIHNVEYLSPLWDELYHILGKIEADYLPQIERMTDDSKRIRRSLSELLDLQQKEESIHEAQNANQQALFAARQALAAQEQADATEAQFQIIFIFTVVTIVFLPLSFLTSYFGMNIDNGQGNTFNYERPYVGKILGGASGPIIGLLLIFAVIWYFVVKRQAAHKRTRNLIELEDQGYLPQNLIPENSPEHKKMQKMRDKDMRRATNTGKKTKAMTTGKQLHGGRLARRNRSEHGEHVV